MLYHSLITTKMLIDRRDRCNNNSGIIPTYIIIYYCTNINFLLLTNKVNPALETNISKLSIPVGIAIVGIFNKSSHYICNEHGH